MKKQPFQRGSWIRVWSDTYTLDDVGHFVDLNLFKSFLNSRPACVLVCMSSPSKEIVVKATFPAEVLPEPSIAKFVDRGLVEAGADTDLDHEGEAVQVLEGHLADLVCWLIITDLIIIITTTTLIIIIITRESL